MILRVFRAGVPFANEAGLIAYVRDEAAPRALTVPGLLSFQPAIERTAAGLELVLVSTWTGFEAILARRQDLDTPVVIPGAGRLLGAGHADHYEFVAGNARGLPLGGERIRLTRVPLVPNTEGAYFDRLRDLGEELLDQSGMVAFLLGRRSVGGTVEAVVVSVYESETARLAIMDRQRDAQGLAGSGSDRWHAAPPTVELLDGLSVVEPAPDAPAILLADDERRYLHATPAAARLTGHSIARLLTMRVDDLTAPELRPQVAETWQRFLAAGSMAAEYLLSRRDGSQLAVRFSAKARTPWPGSHASLLIPATSQARADIDAALVEAGFLSRFVPAG